MDLDWHTSCSISLLLDTDQLHIYLRVSISQLPVALPRKWFEIVILGGKEKEPSVDASPGLVELEISGQNRQPKGRHKTHLARISFNW